MFFPSALTVNTNNKDNTRLHGVSRMLLRLIGKEDAESFRETIQDFIEEHRDTEGVDTHEHALLLNVLTLAGMSIDDIMIPRLDIKAIEIKSSLEDAIKSFIDMQHSRLVVYDSTMDNPVGFLHIKDIVSYLQEGTATRSQDISSIVREALYVPSSVKVLDLLVKMQTTGIHLAIIVDEYGGTDGVITIEDLTNQVVGNIYSRTTEDQPAIQKISDTEIEVDGRVELDQVTEHTNITFESGGHQENDIDTIGGFISLLAGRVPQRGEIIKYPPHCEFHVTDSDPRRIKKIRINKLI